MVGPYSSSFNSNIHDLFIISFHRYFQFICTVGIPFVFRVCLWGILLKYFAPNSLVLMQTANNNDYNSRKIRKERKKKKKKNDHALKIITQEERVRFFGCPIKRTKKNKFIYLDWILYFRNDLNILGGSWRNAERNQFESLWVFFGSCSSSLWTLRLFFRFHRMPNITILNKTTNTFGNISSSTMQIHLSPYFVKSLISQTH